MSETNSGTPPQDPPESAMQVDAAPSRKRRREDDDHVYTRMIANLVNVTPLDPALLEDAPPPGDGLPPRKRFKRGAYAEAAPPQPTDQVERYMDEDDRAGLKKVGDRKPTAYSNAQWGKSVAKPIAAHLTDWIQTQFTADQLEDSEFEGVPDTLLTFRKLHENPVGPRGLVYASEVPASGLQGPHTIAHIMTASLLKTSMPTVFKDRNAYEADTDKLPSSGLFPQGEDGEPDGTPEALRAWAEVELLWHDMDLPRSVAKIIKSETAHLDTLPEAQRTQAKLAAEKTLLAYTEWFNRIEEALNVGTARAREALDDAGDDEADLAQANRDALDEAETVADMIHHLWTAHPYATYCWQDGVKANAEEVGGKGEGGNKFFGAHGDFLDAKADRDTAYDALVANTIGRTTDEEEMDLDERTDDDPAVVEHDRAKAAFQQAQRALADTVGDMVDPYAADHVKDQHGFKDYMARFCAMIDRDEPEDLAELVDRRTDMIRQVYAYAAKIAPSPAFQTFLAGLQEPNDTYKIAYDDLRLMFDGLADDEQADLFLRRVRSLIRQRNKPKK